MREWLLSFYGHIGHQCVLLACFYKGTLSLNPMQLPIESLNLSSLYRHAQQSSHLSICMDIASFSSPVEESLESEEELSSEGLLEQLTAGLQTLGEYIMMIKRMVGQSQYHFQSFQML